MTPIGEAGLGASRVLPSLLYPWQFSGPGELSQLSSLVLPALPQFRDST